MIEIVLVDPSKEFLLGIDYSKGDNEVEDSISMIVIGFILFEIIIYF